MKTDDLPSLVLSYRLLVGEDKRTVRDLRVELHTLQARPAALRRPGDNLLADSYARQIAARVESGETV